jgi:hypothetical protein
LILENHINRLAGALALDSQMRKTFLANPLAAIEEYNTGFARRFGEKPIELNEEERDLVVSIKAVSIQEVYELLNNALEIYQPQLVTLGNTSYGSREKVAVAGSLVA